MSVTFSPVVAFLNGLCFSPPPPHTHPSPPVLPPVFVPTNIHHEGIPLPPLSEDTTLPDNVILPATDPPPPHIFSGYSFFSTTDLPLLLLSLRSPLC